MCDNVIYSQIEILLKSSDVNSHSVSRLEFNKCKLIITYNHIIIEELIIDGSQVAKIFNISEITSYRKTK
jgi:hypothetical protein